MPGQSIASGRDPGTRHGRVEAISTGGSDDTDDDDDDADEYNERIPVYVGSLCL